VVVVDTGELQQVLQSMPFAAGLGIELTDDDGKPAAQVTQAQAVIAPR
jgi:hypothetical protein